MDNIHKARIEILLLFSMLIFILPTRYMIYDFELWTQWALKIHSDGLTNIYGDPTANYHPIFLYVLYIYDLLQGSEFYIKENINYLKFFALVFDFLPIAILCCFRQRLLNKPIPYLLLLLNIAYLFNSICWGQVDSVHTNIMFLALLIAFYYPVASVLLFILALTTKLQAIVLFPILCIILLYSIKNIKQLLLALIAGTALLIVLLLPFIMAGKTGQVWHVVTHAVGFYPRVSVGAYNVWYLIMAGNPYHTMDYNKYFLLSYKHTGLLLFFLASGITLLPLFFRMLRHRYEEYGGDIDTKQLLFLTTGLISLYFFYFNTQMHERYAHPIIIFFFFYAVCSRDWVLYVFASVAYYLSLDKNFPDYLPIHHYKIIFASKVIAIWYTITIGYGVYTFFKRYNISLEYKLLKETINSHKRINA